MRNDGRGHAERTLSLNQVSQSPVAEWVRTPWAGLDRRCWIKRSLLACVAASFGPGAGSLVKAAADEAVHLAPSFQHDLFRVRMELDLEGNVNVPSNPLTSRKAEAKLPVKSDAVLDYEERYRRPIDAAQHSEVIASERFYHEAHSTSRLARAERTLTLRDSLRHAIVRRDVLPEVVYSPNDYYTQRELELLRVPASSVSVDGILPQEAVTVGQTYTPERYALVSLLNLASIEESDVAGEIVEITDEAAKIQLRGKISGSTDGVPTVLRVVAKLTFDRQLGTTTWLAMAVHETREIGSAEPGFDIAATIKMVRKPLTQPIRLAASPAPLAVSEPIPASRLYVDLDSREIGVTALMDRRWRMMKDVPGSAMMRMIENDRSIAQCDLRPLADLKPGQQWTLEAFQADVRRTLGDRLTQLVEADERLSDAGLRVLRITASGDVQGVPIQWVMLHFSDDSGRRVLATFTTDGPNIDAFAGSDVQLANSLRLNSPLPLPVATPTEATAKGSGAAPKVARANDKTRDRVQSASDLQSKSDRR